MQNGGWKRTTAWAFMLALVQSVCADPVAEQSGQQFSWTNADIAFSTNRLDSSRCLEEMDCTRATTSIGDQEAEFNPTFSLNLGGYGPMRFKFTGDRVKLKVKF